MVAPHAGAWIETSWPYGHRSGSQVAPHAGAWIETPCPGDAEGMVMSRPTRARGLKRIIDSIDAQGLQVAPHAGAWIETSRSASVNPLPTVAPHAGAWIETVRPATRSIGRAHV